MAAGLNKATLIGNLGKDPEVRYAQSGTPICTLRIGVTERRPKEGGVWQDQTEWFSVVCFGKIAENVGKYLKKGRQVYVEGRLQNRTWEDREGKQRQVTEVVASQVLFLGSAQADFKPQPDHNGYDQQPTEAFDPPTGFVEDDIPF